MAVSFGVVFVTTRLILSIRFPQPIEFQSFVFRIVLSLAAAGVAAMIPGFISLHLEFSNNYLSVGGAIAVFALVYRAALFKLVVV